MVTLVAVAFAQDDWRALPGVVVEESADATVLRLEGRELVYVRGLGWLSGLDAPAPRVEEGLAYADEAVWSALAGAVEAPPATRPAIADPVAGPMRLTAVRVSGDVDVRVVLDLDGVGTTALGDLAGLGRVGADDRLHLALPVDALPADLPTTVGAFDLRWERGAQGVRLEVGGVAFAYDVFALSSPTRLVLDLRPDRGAVPAPVEEVEVLAPGVTYRSFRAAGAAGPSRVHVLEVAPGRGEWRVVGTSGSPRPTADWADGAFAAINGGYFDTNTRSAIGLFVIDGTWLSPPSRGRAAVGFGPEGVVIDRVSARFGVWLDGRPVLTPTHPAAAQVSVHLVGGAWAGSGQEGVLLLDGDDRVVSNRVGPLRVPAGGRAIAYPPEVRALALADEGTHVRTELRVEPESFGSVRYAVEAGPLLLRDGVAAFEPDREAFARGVRILDEVTQQAAIGVRADGTVLLVAAEAMVAGDLIAVFEGLGARDAMRLDSGGSTTLFADGEVLNRRSERAVANAIVWRPASSP
jgi:hypothetical protein